MLLFHPQSELPEHMSVQQPSGLNAFDCTEEIKS